ncbi:DUF1653 domain-containing protein [Amphritea balenae]|uniref:DUF1653 domain-containing protein n=1 Tax=Amphritea balenae TaxID=452629 RepID=A0A3P1SKG9_9GAMM|nr:DUF1653 domain-containing protein [Amphritea balenae]RRC97783.1 DUF1653 domain-containing protein [Amphritea balenae]GGK82963.1 hypothetical protein GCM10007941_36830 [Amphritea balenae]
MEPLQVGIYRHYKGAEYRVLHTVRHSETEEWLVVYQQCYGDEGLWARPLAMFSETVTDAEGKVVPRFRLVAEA